MAAINALASALLAALIAGILAGCAATPAPPNPDGKHALVTDPWERLGQTLGNAKTPESR